MAHDRQKPRPTNRLIQNAKTLRQQATFPERLLWSRLRRGQIHGHRFRRQHPIANYVVDFYCVDANLIIEVDGNSHIGQKQHDRDRQNHLESLGYRVLRVTNDDILKEIDSVVEGVAHAVKHAADDRHPPTAPPSREGS